MISKHIWLHWWGWEAEEIPNFRERSHVLFSFGVHSATGSTAPSHFRSSFAINLSCPPSLGKGRAQVGGRADPGLRNRLRGSTEWEVREQAMNRPLQRRRDS